MEKTALKWLKHTPTVKITDNSRYMLLDFVCGKYKSQSIQSWQKAALILGLLESQDDASPHCSKTGGSYFAGQKQELEGASGCG